jgi:outer membrane protein OmpA-like peptidoglycan-associated protein
MAQFRFASALASCSLFVCAVLLPAACPAQENPNATPPETKTDAPGCADLNIFLKVGGSIILSCDHQDSVEVTMPLKPDAQGFAREKRVRGIYEFREYQTPRFYQQEQTFQNLMQLAPMAGFIVKYTAQPSTITARKDDTWILINVSDDSYNVSVVRAKEVAWNPPFKNAEEISREMAEASRVAIYGVDFSSGNEGINGKDSKVLAEVVKYLNANPNLAIVIESHKFSTTGNAEDDMDITRKRANAVVDWLVAHGIAAGRLQSKPCGRGKPLTENDTAVEIQQNERIALATAASPN